MKQILSPERQIRRLPRRLTGVELSRRLGLDYQAALRLVRKTNYPMTDGRKYSQATERKFIPEEADWSKSNVELAKIWGVTRERVRAVRKTLKIPLVESRGRKPKNAVDKRPRSGKMGV